MKRHYSTPTRSSCDCSQCQPESQLGNYILFALTIAVVGLFFLFVR